MLEDGAEALSGSPQALLERSAISRGSFYAFFETPDRVLDELALQVVLDSRDWVNRRLGDRPRAHWTEIVDTIMEYYDTMFSRPLVRELWVGQHLTNRIRQLDRIWADEFAAILLAEFEHHPEFEQLTLTQCVIAVEVMERLGQYAYRREVTADGDRVAMSEARRVIENYFASLL
ncbi:TetR/AcrR family transcriptional regulator [Nocardia rhamnosiphila]|uniref:TetR/AcrR family transcriptional regulator n=1 Tax=Nocardia rhamnosiphila TaxID=426716 RepID=A0ABV2WRG0_9NOCA